MKQSQSMLRQSHSIFQDRLRKITENLIQNSQYTSQLGYLLNTSPKCSNYTFIHQTVLQYIDILPNVGEHITKLQTLLTIKYCRTVHIMEVEILMGCFIHSTIYSYLQAFTTERYW